jgi:hypothetical protein
MQRKPTVVGSGRFYPEELEEIDQLADRYSHRRSHEIARLVRLGLAAERAQLAATKAA